MRHNDRRIGGKDTQKWWHEKTDRKGRHGDIVTEVGIEIDKKSHRSIRSVIVIKGEVKRQTGKI